MAPPSRLLYRDYEDAVGGLREDFFVEAMKQAGILNAGRMDAQLLLRFAERRLQ